MQLNKRLILLIFFIMLLLPIQSFAYNGDSNSNTEYTENEFNYNYSGGQLDRLNKDFKELQKELKFAESVMRAFFIATATLILIIQIVRAVGFQPHPFQRNKIIMEIGVIFICIALSAISPIIVQLFASLFIN